MNYNYQKNNIISQIKGLYRSKPALVNLIVINIAVWLLINIFEVLSYLFNKQGFAYALALNYGAVPSNLNVLLTKPWTIFSYMFLHIEFLHLLFNMLWLYWFGILFVQFLGEKKLYLTYVISGLTGALFFIIAYNIFPAFSEIRQHSTALGASASVLGIVVAIAFYMPDYELNLMFFGRVKIKYIAIFTLLMDLLLIKSSNPGGHLAHLGGAFWGFIYVLFLKKNWSESNAFFKRILKIFKKSEKFKYKKVYTNQRVVSDEEYNARRAERQKKTDEILDKISKYGYDRLSKEEKEFLFKSGNDKS